MSQVAETNCECSFFMNNNLEILWQLVSKNICLIASFCFISTTNNILQLANHFDKKLVSFNFKQMFSNNYALCISLNSWLTCWVSCVSYRVNSACKLLLAIVSAF